MMPFRQYLRRLPHTLMFWLFVAVVVGFALRLAFPREGFDLLDTGEGSLDLAAADDGVWVLNYEEHSVTLVDPADVGVVFTASVGDEVAPTIAADGDGALVLLDQASTLARVDPVTEDVTDRIDVEGALDGPAQDLAAGAGWIWLTGGTSGFMAQVDSGSGEIVQTIDLDQNVVQPQIVGDSLWVVRADGMAEYDVDTGEERRVVETDRRARGYAVGGSTLWLLTDVRAELEQGTVVSIDLDTGQETGAIVVAGTRPAGITLAGADELVVSGSGGMMVRLSADPVRAVAAEEVDVQGANLRSPLFWEGRIWAADGVDGVVYPSVEDIQAEPTTGTTVP